MRSHIRPALKQVRCLAGIDRKVVKFFAMHQAPLFPHHRRIAENDPGEIRLVWFFGFFMIILLYGRFLW
jgi:hypothetical protein